MSRALTRVAESLFAIAAIAVVGLYGQFAMAGGPGRHRVESAATWMALLAAIVLAARAAREGATDGGERLPVAAPLALCLIAAAALFWPVRGIGFLSDDWVLAEKARLGAFGSASTMFFRPLPLLLWRGVLALGGGPAVLHGLNVLLHGANGYLVARVAAGWMPRWAAWMAGALFIVMPIAAEPVAWACGVFDVLCVTGCLSAVLLARGADASRWRWLAVAAAAAVAILSKETAIVLPGLLVVDAWAGGRPTRGAWRSVLAVSIPFAAFAAWRLAAAGHDAVGTLTKYVVQRAVFSAVGTLASPWHALTILGHPTLAIASATAAVALLSLFVWSPLATRRTASQLALAAGWVLMPCLPVLFFLPVSPDLQGSRYLYLPAVGWVLGLCRLASAGRPRLVAVGILACMIVWNAAGLRLQLRPWRLAGDTTAAVLDAVAPFRARCETIQVLHAPDTVNGAYVFRNGLPEAIAAAAGPVADATGRSAACVLEWDASARTLSRVR